MSYPIDFGYDVLSTNVNGTNGVISAQIGDSVTEDVRGDNAEWWQHVGFASRPSNPVSGKAACQVISLESTDRDICFASRDNRIANIYGSLSPGETCLYAAGPNATGTNRFLQKDNGTVSTQTMLCQVGNQSSGKPVIVQISSDDGGKITMAAGENGAISIDSTGIKFTTPGKLQFGGSDDFAIVGNTVTLNGGNVQLGANPTEGVVLGGPAFLTWVANIQARMAVLEGILRTVPVVNGSPVSSTIDTLTVSFPITFPAAEVSTTVKATP